MVLSIEPTLYDLDPSLVAAVDTAAPEGAQVPMAARDPDEIPRVEPEPELDFRWPWSRLYWRCRQWLWSRVALSEWPFR